MRARHLPTYLPHRPNPPVIDADKAARAQAKKAKEDAKEQRREAKVGKQRARED